MLCQSTSMTSIFGITWLSQGGPKRLNLHIHYLLLQWPLQCWLKFHSAPTLSCNIVGKHKARTKCVDVRWLLAQPSPCGSCWSFMVQGFVKVQLPHVLFAALQVVYLVWYFLAGQWWKTHVGCQHMASGNASTNQSLCWNLSIPWDCF